MTTTRDKKVIAYIKSIYEIVGAKGVVCMDKTITYYRAYDKPYTWHIHNALSFVCDYNSQVPSGIAHNGQTKINCYLKALMRTINHIVFDGVKESKYQAHMLQHLKTFLHIAHMSDTSGLAGDAIDLIAKKCSELYSPVDPSIVDPKNPLNLLDVEDIKDSFVMVINNVSLKSTSYTDASVVKIDLTNRSTKDITSIELVFHF